MNSAATPQPAGLKNRLTRRDYVAGVMIVFGRELESLFDSSIAYIYFIAFAALTTAVFMNDFFIRAVADMTPYFRMLPIILIVFVPALTMRVWAEEKRAMTFELLMTLPLHKSQIVLGKYLALYAYYLLTLMSALPITVMLFALGSPDAGLIFSCYLGAALFGAVFVSLGVFTSGLSGNQIVAFVIAALFGFLFVFTGNDAVVAALDGLTPDFQTGTFLYEAVSIMPHYESLVKGVLDTADLVYFAAMSALFLWMNSITVDRSKG